MDVWHWTSLVALLCYAGLKSIPDAYYQAAQIEGASRWAVFTAIQLPKMNRVLLFAALLRFMDSFMIYTEPFVVTGAGPAIRPPSSRSNWSRSRSASSTSARQQPSRCLQFDHPDRVLDFYTVMSNVGADRPASKGAE